MSRYDYACNSLFFHIFDEFIKNSFHMIYLQVVTKMDVKLTIKMRFNLIEVTSDFKRGQTKHNKMFNADEVA